MAERVMIFIDGSNTYHALRIAADRVIEIKARYLKDCWKSGKPG